MKIRPQTLPKSDMWKTLLLLACVASCVLIVCCDEGDTDQTAETNPTGETNDTGETLPTEETKPTEETDDCSGNPPRCGKNEVYDNCTYTGCIPKLCSEIGFPLKCDKKCKPGCVCKGNYVRDEDGTCIPIPDCPSCGGDKNAEQGCGNHCGQSCADYNKPRPCPPFCIFNGCNCRKGFVYDPNVKACVKPKDCTPTCQANEEYSACVNGGCDARNCSQLGKPVPCVKLPPESCIKGCVCVAGYLRASNGTCVPKDQCPQCGKNEVYNNCSDSACVPRKCSELGFPLKCDQKCKPGCVCKDEYVRNDDGTCIPILNCPSCGGDKNAQRGCSNYCGHSCSDYNKPGFCPLFCMSNGCDCKPGFVYDYNVKACVKPKDCTPTCKVNEEYSACVNGGCDARNCSQLGKPVPCVKLPPKSCIKGCICVAGYLRASNGTCVPKEQCFPKCEKLNEVYDVCPAPCPPKLCNVNEDLIRCKAPPKPGDPECKPGCRCADTYYRNATGTCVPKNKCEKPLKCDRPNEVYDACPAICPPQECGVNPALILCMRNPDYGDPNCKPGCVCIDGYVRNNARECIPRDKCPKCTGKNEYYEPCIQGCSNQTCDSIGKTYFCPYEKGCRSGCRCNPGYYRNADNVCVPESECPHTCPANEEYSTCVNGGCDARNCSQLGKPVPCVKLPPKSCIKGCVCVAGYLRASNGTCVPKDQCSPKCEEPNEVYDVCPAPCPPKLCNVNEALIKCKAPPKPGDPECKPGCRCADNYYRNATGTCVLKINCEKPLKCDRPNEVYDACPAICPTRECGVNPALIRCMRSPEYGDPSCKPSCVCVDEYVRNNAKECIPRDKCPQCGANERYVVCPDTMCIPQNCSQRGFPVPCPILGPEGRCPGKPKCICVENYLRDDDSGICIPSKKCSPICKVNEKYSSCVNGGCDARNCSQVGKPVPCVDLAPENCIKGCVCVDGYLRADNGTCVPKDQCTPTCTGKNEYYDNCIQGCSNQSCSDIGQSFSCPAMTPGQCKSGCRCKAGFWRNDKNICVPQDECPKPTCPDGEVWEWCPTIKCDGDNCPKTRDSPQTCPVGIVCDKPRCICGYNRKRDWKTGKCIPIPDCPPFKCDRNEEYKACPEECSEESCYNYINKTKCLPLKIGIIANCRPACICKKGYYRNGNKACVEACDCSTKS